jgi:hypothetical protein
LLLTAQRYRQVVRRILPCRLTKHVRDRLHSGKPAFRKPVTRCSVSSGRLKYLAVND